MTVFTFAQAHLVDRLAHRIARHISAQIDDERATARLENAIHLLQCPHWLREILERRAAQQEIERLVCKRHTRCVAVPEIDIHPCRHGIPPRDLDKRVADTEARDPVAAELRQFDRKVSRARRDFEHRASRPGLRRNPPRQRLEILSRFARERSVPPGCGALHAHPFVSLLRDCLAHELPFRQPS